MDHLLLKSASSRLWRRFCGEEKVTSGEAGMNICVFSLPGTFECVGDSVTVSRQQLMYPQHP